MFNTHGQLSRNTVGQEYDNAAGLNPKRVLLPRGTRYRIERKYWDRNGTTWARLVVRSRRYDVVLETAGSEGTPNG